MNSPRKEEEDTAMLAKKPIGGWSCASCEKDLINISGRAPGYQAWSKLPFRAPGDRIAKVGQGFSKMLALVNPNQTFQQQNYATTKASSKVPPIRDLDQIPEGGSQKRLRMANSTTRDFNQMNRFPQTFQRHKISNKFKKSGYQSANVSMDEADGESTAVFPNIGEGGHKLNNVSMHEPSYQQ